MTFQVSQLKPFNPNYLPIYTDLQRSTYDLEAIPLQPEDILESLLVKNENFVIYNSASDNLGRSVTTLFNYSCSWVKQVLQQGEV